MLKKMMVKLIAFVRLEFIHPEKKISDDELMPRLRALIHVLEKRISEEETDFLKMISAHNLYFEAKKRKLLSSNEIDWCEHVLFGKIKQHKDIHNVENSHNFSIVVKNRRSIRSWKKAKINNEIFEELVETAKYAPSSCNRQPWHFVVTGSKEKLDLICTVKGQKFLKNAPYCILVLINKNAWSREDSYKYFSGLDAGAAIQNLLLKAEDLGLGACWVNWEPASISRIEDEKIKKSFDIPKNYEIISLIAIGKPNEKPLPPGRKDTKDIIHMEKFNDKNLL
jgi:nitroreductase